jgi:hypothetical protein
MPNIIKAHVSGISALLLIFAFVKGYATNRLFHGIASLAGKTRSYV